MKVYFLAARTFDYPDQDVIIGHIYLSQESAQKALDKVKKSSGSGVVFFVASRVVYQ